MDLRYRLAVVTGAGDGSGRAIAVALSRLGAAVLSADPDLCAAEDTASLVREARVRAWALEVDLEVDTDVALLAARAQDLGGMDLLVVGSSTLPARIRLTQIFLDGLGQRRGRRDGTPAVVNLCPPVADLHGATASPDGGATAAAGVVRFTRSLAHSDASTGARVMAVVPGTRWPDRAGVTTPSEVARVVVGLLSRGAPGQVVELGQAPGGLRSKPGG